MKLSELISKSLKICQNVYTKKVEAMTKSSKLQFYAQMYN